MHTVHPPELWKGDHVGGQGQCRQYWWGVTNCSSPVYLGISPSSLPQYAYHSSFSIQQSLFSHFHWQFLTYLPPLRLYLDTSVYFISQLLTFKHQMGRTRKTQSICKDLSLTSLIFDWMIDWLTDWIALQVFPRALKQLFGWLVYSTINSQLLIICCIDSRCLSLKDVLLLWNNHIFPHSKPEYLIIGEKLFFPS